MKIMTGIAAAILIVAALIIGSTESQSQGCDRGGNHNIQVRPQRGQMPTLRYRGGSADEIHVCPGDRVQWTLTGPERTFFIDFLSGGPFEGATRRGSNGNVVSIFVGANATGSYKYDVDVEGDPVLDPRIVVD